MKSLLICLFYLALTGSVLAQSDSSAYITQKNKINQLLAERSEKFGQYDISLKKRTGIFGLKTKRDLQYSNDILTEIVLTDNHIFSELKILLDYKDYEKQEVETRAQSVEGYIANYQSTITRLQKENERLRTEIEKNEKDKGRLYIYLIVFLILFILVVLYVLKLKKLRKTDTGQA